MPIDDYTVTADEQSTTAFDWGEIRWLDSHDLLAQDALTVGEVTIRPGASNPEHRHANCDEALYLLSGTLEHTIGDERVTLEAGDLIHVPRGERHRATNPGHADAVALIAYDAGERAFELTGGD